jgi:hypothetical protein
MSLALKLEKSSSLPGSLAYPSQDAQHVRSGGSHASALAKLTPTPGLGRDPVDRAINGLSSSW